MSERVERGCTIVVAAPTPFMANGAADLAGLKSNIARWVEAGVDGVLVLGSTGEAIHLDDSESDQVIAAAREALPADRELYVGTGRSTTAATIRQSLRAAELGADIALVLTPHYYKQDMTDAALGRFYTAVANSSRVPVYLYSMPALTGVSISAGLAAQLSSHARIAGLKDSSGDVAGLFERVEACPSEFRIVSGSARAVYPALAAGVRGSILAIACVAPEIAVEAHRAWAHGDADASRRASATLARLSARLSPLGIPGLKAAMTVRGYAGGICRQPLSFDFKAMRDVESALAEAGLSDRS
ncbi:MAG TPA: dihydrodipicolinate synthase family protein [Blastocatellia bacterium]|nr:dihydrodipicolinate synthase family protein [Blastocatellia bacterium]